MCEPKNEGIKKKFEKGRARKYIASNSSYAINFAIINYTFYVRKSLGGGGGAEKEKKARK